MQPINQPIVAIVGSARQEIMGDTEPQARQAAQLIGAELAKCGWSIAVYGSQTDYIEHDVVKGYLTATEKKPSSIVCIYPIGTKINFEGINDYPDCFEMQPDTSPDWEVSFYRSLFKMDGILLFGGMQSAFIAGQVSLSRDLPIVAVGSFRGAAQKIWQEHLSKKPGNIDNQDLQIMGRWNSASPADIVGSLTGQYKKNEEKLKAQNQDLVTNKQKAAMYDQLMLSRNSQKNNAYLALVFLSIFLVCFILGLVGPWPDWRYITMCVIGLCFAGGMGATIRMLAPKAPETTSKWSGPILGVMVGLVFSLIYLIPQLVQQSGFLIPDSIKAGITPALRAQYICSMLVAVLAGLGFDYALEQLIKKSRSDVERLATSKQH
jgi:hypothetical protein